MRCFDAKNRLDVMKNVLDVRGEPDLDRHLEQCPECSEYRDDLLLTGLMASMPVREPSFGFKHRVLRDAKEAAGSSGPSIHVRWALATAASMLIAVLLTLQLSPNDTSRDSLTALQPVMVSVVPNQTRIINVLLNSNRELENAQLSIALDENLELEGYSGIHTLEWSAVLSSGENYLALPVRLINGESGTITVIIRHENSSRRLTISVNALPENNGQKVTMA
jgi:hypothetical protein